MNTSSNLVRIGAAACLGVIAFSLGGCYLLDSARGQLSLMAKRRPITAVLDDGATPPALRTQLSAVRSIRDFATRELGLPDNGSYRSYADVGRQYVVWNVVAAPELSVDPRQWCFPIVGCVAYRGYFELRKAQAFAADLRKQGFDVAVEGVAAYSTLGHFDDPILNTMMGWSDVDLAAIVFHELTHQLLYVAGDASFDEAFATVVEEEGVRRWLESTGRSADLGRHRLQQQRYLEVIRLLQDTREQLRTLYGSGLAPEILRARKRDAFTALRAAYVLRTAQWEEPKPFASWFAHDLNNAQLASVATYYDCVPGFERQLAAVGGDLEAFYRRVRELASLDAAARDAAVCSATVPPPVPSEHAP